MDVTNAIVVFGAVSLSSERAVEMIKKIVPGLGKQHPEQSVERWRKFALRLITIIVGGFIAMAAGAQISQALPDILGQTGVGYREAIIIGLFSAGGSGMWSQALGYVNRVKDIKKLDLAEARKLLEQAQAQAQA